MSEPESDIENLITRYLAGETSDEEGTQLMAWRKVSTDNELYFKKLEKAFKLATNYRTRVSPEINLDEEWSVFKSKVEEKESEVRPISTGKTASFSWLRIAAALLLLLLASYAVNYLVNKNRVTNYETQNNSLAVDLPDGSRVVLNRNSKISYTSEFGKENREVSFSGEAFFEITEDKKKPFIIDMKETEVMVVGTSFNIRNYSQEATEVAVQSGVVKFSAPSLKQEVLLQQGEKGVYKKETNTLTSAANEDINFLSWKTRKIVFENADLQTVVETLNKTYGSDIRVMTAVPPGCALTATFDQQSLEAVLNVLKNTLNLTIRVNGTRIEIIQAGC